MKSLKMGIAAAAVTVVLAAWFFTPTAVGSLDGQATHEPVVQVASLPLNAGELNSANLTYEGQGYLEMNFEAGKMLLVFGDVLDKLAEVDGIVLGLDAPDYEGQLWAEGWVSAYSAGGELFVSVDGIGSEISQVTYLTFIANLQAAKIESMMQAAQESPLDACPGGTCTCSSDTETVKACCPAGSSPWCTCTPAHASANCYKDKTATVARIDVASLFFEEVSPFPFEDDSEATVVGELHFAGLAIEKRALMPVDLPYYGPGSVAAAGDEIVIRFGDPTTENPYEYEGVALGYTSSYEFYQAGEGLYVEVTEDGQLYLEINDIAIYFDFALTSDGVEAGRQVMNGVQQQVIQDMQVMADSLKDCPWGYCSCKGEDGTASACCPAGKTPKCSCLVGATATCVSDVTAMARVSISELMFIEATPAGADAGELHFAGLALEKQALMPVELPYYGPGMVIAESGEIHFRFCDPETTDSAKYEAVSLGYQTPFTFFEQGDLFVEVTDEGRLYVEVGEVVIDFDFGLTDEGVEDARQVMDGAEHQAAQEATTQPACPGGSCTCTGPKGTASACCPAGKTPKCSCTIHASIGNCTKDATKKTQVHMSMMSFAEPAGVAY